MKIQLKIKVLCSSSIFSYSNPNRTYQNGVIKLAIMIRLSPFSSSYTIFEILAICTISTKFRQKMMVLCFSQALSMWLSWQPELIANLYKMHVLSIRRPMGAINKTCLRLAEQLQSFSVLKFWTDDRRWGLPIL